MNDYRLYRSSVLFLRLHYGVQGNYNTHYDLILRDTRLTYLLSLCKMLEMLLSVEVISRVTGETLDRHSVL